MNKSKLFIVSAPSGSGKTTLCNKLLMEFHNEIYFSVSYTTRKKRTGEKQGVDYFFISEQKFREMIDNNEFAEWANVYGFLYGTAKSKIEEAVAQKKNILFDIDVKGAAKIKENYPQSISIFIMPPSLSELRRRLLHRATDSEDKIKNRLKIAEREMTKSKKYDYVIINDNLYTAYTKLRSIYSSDIKE